jgi:predicted O-methyltransferase YrrM
MNTKTIQRRDFLRGATGALGLAALTEAFGSFELDAQTGARAQPDKASLDRLMADLEAKGRRMLSVPRKDGQFLNLLVKASRARNVLEVGTSQGYSAIWLSLGLEETGGKLTTIEIDPEKVRLAKTNVTQAGLVHRVTFKEGDAHQVVPSLEGTFDFVFLDADKEGQMDYFKKLYPNKLPPGAVLAVHNAIRQRDSMGDFLDMINGHPDFDSVILSLTMDDGFSVSYRKRQ